MMAAFESPCVWITTDRNIFGISVKNLIQLGKDDYNIDWNSLPSASSCFDYSLVGLPEFTYVPLIYDSNIFLTTTYSSEVYRLEFFQKDNNQDETNEKQLLHLSKVPPESIPSLPMKEPHIPFLANIGGKVYFLANDAFAYWMYGWDSDTVYLRDSWEDWDRDDWNVKESEGFWVLDPTIGNWRSLDFPMPIGDIRFEGQDFFTYHDKIFGRFRFIPESEYYWYCFDPQTEKWNKVGEAEGVELFHISIETCPISLVHPYENLTIALTEWYDGKRPGCYCQEPLVAVKLSAVLLDSKNNVWCSQHLDELFEGWEYPLFVSGRVEVKMLDLGNGLACAMVTGVRYDYGKTFLWVTVFSLSCSAQVEIDAAPSREEKKQRKFLDVELCSNRLFHLPPHPLEDRDRLCHAFLY